MNTNPEKREIRELALDTIEFLEDGIEIPEPTLGKLLAFILSATEPVEPPTVDEVIEATHDYLNDPNARLEPEPLKGRESQEELRDEIILFWNQRKRKYHEMHDFLSKFILSRREGGQRMTFPEAAKKLFDQMNDPNLERFPEKDSDL